MCSVSKAEAASEDWLRNHSEQEVGRSLKGIHSINKLSCVTSLKSQAKSDLGTFVFLFTSTQQVLSKYLLNK